MKLLLNILMISVGRRLEELPGVQHTVYADDITLWVPGGSNGFIETLRQRAVDAIEDQLDGSGLICSPSKLELLVLPPKGARKKTEPTEHKKIKITTSSGQVIPEIEEIRVLGRLIEKRRTKR